MEFRHLKPSEIKCRVKTSGIKKDSKGNKTAWTMLLLYKDARCDMAILDETFGSENWQRKHEAIGNDLYCSVGVRVKRDDSYEWIWKQDCGTEGESGAEAEKSRASDSFKRACINLGIGRELYTSPSIFVYLKDNEYEERNGNICVSNKLFLHVTYIDYDEKGHIKSLVIRDRNNEMRFVYGDIDFSKIKEEN